jgi:hypothetical protein
MARWFGQLVACSLVCILSVGCSGSGPDLGTVKGKVTLDGKALPNLLITFVPEGGGRASTGTTDAEGNYALIFADQDGALIGKHRVTVKSLQPPAAVKEVSSDDPEYQKQILGAQSDSTPAPKEIIPAKYSGNNSELVQEVKSGENIINLDLKSG